MFLKADSGFWNHNNILPMHAIIADDQTLQAAFVSCPKLGLFVECSLKKVDNLEPGMCDCDSSQLIA